MILKVFSAGQIFKKSLLHGQSFGSSLLSFCLDQGFRQGIVMFQIKCLMPLLPLCTVFPFIPSFEVNFSGGLINLLTLCKRGDPPPDKQQSF